jgi:hypothetical protein
MILIAVKNFVAGLSRNAELAADLAYRLAVQEPGDKSQTFSMIEHSFHGIDDTSRPETKSVTHVSVTKCHHVSGAQPDQAQVLQNYPRKLLKRTYIRLRSFFSRSERETRPHTAQPKLCYCPSALKFTTIRRSLLSFALLDQQCSGPFAREPSRQPSRIDLSG